MILKALTFYDRVISSVENANKRDTYPKPEKFSIPVTFILGGKKYGYKSNAK